MSIKAVLLILTILLIIGCGQKDRNLITTYGAIADGKTNNAVYWNNDGIYITDCKKVKITNCFINSADDGICLKSSNPDSNCDDIYIDSCTVRSSAGALKLGTSSAGGFKNIKVRNLTVLQIES